MSPLYDLPNTTKEVYNAFTRTNESKATKEDYELLDKHIAEKKKAIKEAKIRLNIDGYKSRSAPLELDPLSVVMREVDGGRRLQKLPRSTNTV